MTQAPQLALARRFIVAALRAHLTGTVVVEEARNQAGMACLRGNRSSSELRGSLWMPRSDMLDWAFRMTGCCALSLSCGRTSAPIA